MDYTQILPELFPGLLSRSADHIDRLCQEAAITAVLNLQTDDDMRWPNLGPRRRNRVPFAVSRNTPRCSKGAQVSSPLASIASAKGSGRPSSM